MSEFMIRGFRLVILISALVSLKTFHGEAKAATSSSPFLGAQEQSSTDSKLQYNFYQNSCPEAVNIVWTTMARIVIQNTDAAPSLLRLLFHDCFVQGCDASVLLDDSNGNKNNPIEKNAIPNQTLRGFDKIDAIKEELEKTCPGVVSCADILALAARDGIVLTGGPFYPVFTGRRDSAKSYFQQARVDIPRPDGYINETLQSFSRRGFSERETVSLLGAHNIGKIGCDFIRNRIANFLGTGEPDPTIPSDFLNIMRLNCQDSDSDIESSLLDRSGPGMSYNQELAASLSSGTGFDTHYYQSLLNGRGILFADQQLMAHETTARLVRAYASDDGSTFRRDFARAMVKLSNLGVLTGSRGQVRLNCSLPAPSN